MTRWTQADVDRVRAGRTVVHPPSKYHNVRVVTIDGEKFDSKREATHWIELKVREHAKEIRALERQVPFDLMAPLPTRDGFVVVAQYVADFVYIDCATGKQIIEDSKGTRTREYLLKRKWLELQDGIEIQEV